VDAKGEVFAKQAFQVFLERAGFPSSRWRRGREPPDYYLRVAERRYVVEVTRAMQNTEVGGVKRTEHGWRAALTDFAKRVERRAKAEGILSGTYGMQLVPVANFWQLEPGVIGAALEYVRETQDAETASRLHLASGSGGPSLTIEKVGPKPDYVGGNISIGHAKRGVQIRRDLTAILNERLHEKRTRLARTRLPRILLVIDSYLYGEAAHWCEVASQLSFSGFHTVARIPDYLLCQILKTDDPVWRTAV